jgi:hypothetical protein
MKPSRKELYDKRMNELNAERQHVNDSLQVLGKNLTF